MIERIYVQLCCYCWSRRPLLLPMPATRQTQIMGPFGSTRVGGEPSPATPSLSTNRALSTTVYDFEVQALNEKGAEAIARQTSGYNSYFDELSSSDLATVKADGSVIAVDERAIRDQPASADTSSPYFDERRQRIIAYSHVAPGDKVRGRLTYKAKRPMFAGEFAHYWSQPADQPPETIELTVEGPAARPLRIARRNVEHAQERSGDQDHSSGALQTRGARSRARLTMAGSTTPGVSRSARSRIMPLSPPC